MRTLPKTTESENKKYLSFQVLEHSFAISMLEVQEVFSPPKEAPKEPIDGSTFFQIPLRGKRIPVLDLRQKLGAPPFTQDSPYSIL